MSDPIISVEHLGKCYRIRHQQARQPYVALRDVITEKTTGVTRRLWSALRVVFFEVKLWEILGIIGRNGAGKSTLLKILS